MKSCSKCKKSSPIEELFIPLKSKEFYCPECFSEVITKKGKQAWLTWILGLTVCIWGAITYPDDKFFYLGVTFFSWGVVNFISITIHELVHYLFTKLLGGYCPRVSFGEGGLIYSFHSKHTIWELRASPSLGITYVAFPTHLQQGWRYLVVLASAGLVNLSIAVSAFLLVYFEAIKGLHSLIAVFIIVFGVVNLLLFFSAFWPRVIRAGQSTDGAQILEILKKNDAFFDKLHMGYQLNIADALISRGEYATLITFIESCKDYENSPLHCSCLEYAYIQLGKLDIALEYSNRSIELLETHDKDCLPLGSSVEALKAIFLNNLAFALYLMNSEDSERMVNAANFAYQNIPWNDAIISTWASIQIEYGDLSKGISLLEKLVSKKREIDDKCSAQNYASLAIGYRKANKLDEMNKAKAKSIALDPHCILLERI